jgi:hypothetical protein
LEDWKLGHGFMVDEGAVSWTPKKELAMEAVTVRRRAESKSINKIM